MKYKSDSDKDTNYFYICKSDLEITETIDHAMPWPTAYALRNQSNMLFKTCFELCRGFETIQQIFFFTLLSTV